MRHFGFPRTEYTDFSEADLSGVRRTTSLICCDDDGLPPRSYYRNRNSNLDATAMGERNDGLLYPRDELALGLMPMSNAALRPRIVTTAVISGPSFTNRAQQL